MRRALIIALLLTGCTRSYEYHQVDEDLWQDRVIETKVTDVEEPILDKDTLNLIAAVGTVLVVVLLLAGGGGSE